MPVADNFKDAELASNYQKFRPQYPQSLTNHIISLLDQPQSGDRHGLAVDVGCGSGQTTLPLAPHFLHVMGVDPSEAQVNEARKSVSVSGVTNITYRVGMAERLDFLEDASVDLITVGTALHWFDVERFCEECVRILKPGGVVVAYGYGIGKLTLLDLDQRNLEEGRELFSMLLTQYGDPHIQHVHDKYVNFQPIFQKHFSETSRTETAAVLRWSYSVEGFRGYLKSLSMYQKYKISLKDGEQDQVDAVVDRLMQSFGGSAPEEAILYTSDVHCLTARK